MTTTLATCHSGGKSACVFQSTEPVLSDNVALSRGKDLEQVYLIHCDLEAIKADSEAIAEYERLEVKAEKLNRPHSHSPSFHSNILNSKFGNSPVSFRSSYQYTQLVPLQVEPPAS
jgi:hypothetical protein